MDNIVTAIILGLVTAIAGFFLGKRYESRNLARSIELAQNTLDSLERLSELHRKGELTDEEWNEQKRMLLYWPTNLSNRSRLLMLQRHIKNPDILLNAETEVLYQDRKRFEKLVEKSRG